MEKTAQTIGGLCWFVVGIVQIVATADGVAHFTGWGSLGSWVIALLMGWTPILGTVTGIYGAHAAWGWLASLTLFLWPFFIVIPILMIISTIVDRNK